MSFDGRAEEDVDVGIAADVVDAGVVAGGDDAGGECPGAGRG